MTPAADAPTRPALRYHGAKWVLSSWIVSCLPERGRPEPGRPERGRPERGRPERGQPERGHRKFHGGVFRPATRRSRRWIHFNRL